MHTFRCYTWACADFYKGFFQVFEQKNMRIRLITFPQLTSHLAALCQDVDYPAGYDITISAHRLWDFSGSRILLWGHAFLAWSPLVRADVRIMWHRRSESQSQLLLGRLPARSAGIVFRFGIPTGEQHGEDD